MRVLPLWRINFFINKQTRMQLLVFVHRMTSHLYMYNIVSGGASFVTVLQVVITKRC